MQTDQFKTGKLTKKECYTVLKGARLPLDNELLEKILEVYVKHPLNIKFSNCNVV